MEESEQHDSGLQAWATVAASLGQGSEGSPIRPTIEEDPFPVGALFLLRAINLRQLARRTPHHDRLAVDVTGTGTIARVVPDR